LLKGCTVTQELMFLSITCHQLRSGASAIIITLKIIHYVCGVTMEKHFHFLAFKLTNY